MFYTVVVIEPGTFESKIVDERHFGDKAAAEEFVCEMKEKNFMIAMAKLESNIVA